MARDEPALDLLTHVDDGADLFESADQRDDIRTITGARLQHILFNDARDDLGVWLAAYLAVKGKVFTRDLKPEDLPVHNFVMGIFHDAGMVTDNQLQIMNVIRAWGREAQGPRDEE